MKTPATLAIALAALVTALAAVTTTPAHAEVYKWVDANGRVQFSDKPPPDQKGVKQVDIKNTTPSEANKAAAEQRAQAARDRAAQSDQAKAAAAKAEAKGDNKTAANKDDGKSELQKSEECFAQYRTTTGRLLPEAGEKCKEVKIPN
jgi:regulator of protease activity HflC (stomatin/prohibitin superfamily)